LEDFVTWLEGGESLIGELSERVKQLWRNFASGEIDFANHPILSLLRMIVRLIDTAIEGYQRFLNRLEGGGASLMDKALDKFLENAGAVGLLYRVSKWGRKKRSEGLVERTEQEWAAQRAHWEAMGFQLPDTVTPSASGGMSVEQNVSVEINFGGTDGSNPAAIEDAVRRGVGGALRDAAASMTPAGAF